MSAHAAGAHRGRRVMPWHKEWTVGEVPARVVIGLGMLVGAVGSAVLVTGWLERAR